MSPLSVLFLVGGIGLLVLWALRATRERRRIAQEEGRRRLGSAESGERPD